MNKTELKYNVNQTGSNFFSKDAMKFFGDTMANYSVPKNPITITDSQNNKVEVYQLKRKNPVKNGLHSTTYFNSKTFTSVFAKDETHS